MAGEPILVVDDNPTNLVLVRFILESRGYAVATATGLLLLARDYSLYPEDFAAAHIQMYCG